MRPKLQNSKSQLKLNFENTAKEVKVISIQRSQNRELNTKILNRKRH
jgi:hypothetical protein